MSIILNLIWLVLGGFFVFCGYFIGGIALCMTVIGIPWGIQCFKISILALFPFGSQVTNNWPESSPTGGVNIPVSYTHLTLPTN